MGAWGKDAHGGLLLGIWAKSYNVGGVSGGVSAGVSAGVSGGVIAEMEFRRIMGWTNRAYHGD